MLYLRWLDTLSRETPLPKLFISFSKGVYSKTEGIIDIQSNLESSKTDSLFTMANSNSFLSPYEILPIVQEKKYLGKFSYFIVKLCVVCTH